MADQLIIIGSELDPHVHEVSMNLKSSFECFDIYTLPNVSIDLDQAKLTINDTKVNLQHPIRVWYRQKGPFVEISPVANNTLEALERKDFFEKTWYKFTSSISTFSSDSRVTNPVKSKFKSNNKAYQLHVAIEVGLKVPRTILTNDIDRVRNFSNGDVLLKSLGDATIGYAKSGSNLAFSAKKVQVETLITHYKELSFQPVIIQDYIEKAYELRIYWISGKIIAVKIDSQSKQSTKYDWRPGQGDSTMFSTINCPETLKDKITKYMSIMHLDFGAFDFIVTPDGKHVFLECNPDGQWLFTDSVSANMITAAMAYHMDKF